MAAALITALLAVASVDGPSSGAAGSGNPSVSPVAERSVTPRVSAPENCPAVKRALRFYSARFAFWQAQMGAGTFQNGKRVESRDARIRRGPDACPRYLAHVLQRKAYGARRAFARWHAHHYDWRSWLPAKWYRIARCETGTRWDWNSGPYQGAFGFAVSSWDAFKLRGYPSEAYLATPREQYEVALAIWRRYGFSGWGCRNA